MEADSGQGPKVGVEVRSSDDEHRSPTVVLGVDRILKAPSEWRGILKLRRALSLRSKIGLVTSAGAPPGPGSTLSTRGALLEAGLPLARIFTPEHGLTATAADGSSSTDEVDPETGLRVVSLYGPRFTPGAAELAGLNLVLFDLQDAGVRFYTFLWTLCHLMEACARARVPLRVLDRPNPLGGLPCMVEGPIQDRATPPSLLGRWPIPIRHSMTMGEMALLLRTEMGLEVDLEVVTMEGWKREMLWTDTGLPFCPPSPGLPSFPSVLLYPGLALLEATNLSVGRGASLAFQWLGAPWVDGERLAGLLNATGPPGVFAHAKTLDLNCQEICAVAGCRDREQPPQAPQTPGQSDGGRRSPCPGVFLEVTDPVAHRPVALGLRIMALLRTSWPAEFSWQRYPTAANPAGDNHLLRLLGSADLTRAIEEDPLQLTEDLVRASTGAEGWWRRAEQHLLYALVPIRNLRWDLR